MIPGIEYLAAAKTTLDLLKGLVGLLPKGNEADDANKLLKKTEEALKNSEAELAKKLGYHLCRCTWPPQIMLWNKDRRKHVCPSCGDIWPPIQGVSGPIQIG